MAGVIASGGEHFSVGQQRGGVLLAGGDEGAGAGKGIGSAGHRHWQENNQETPKQGDNRGLGEASGSERAICIHGGEFFREPEATGFGMEGKYHF